MSKHWTVTYTIKDSRGKLGRFLFYLPREMPAAMHTYLAEPPKPFPDDEVEHFCNVMTHLIHAMIEGQIVKVTISRDIDLSAVPGMRTAPLPGSNVEEALRYTYVSANGLWSHELPTVRQDAFNNGVHIVDFDITDEIPGGPQIWLPNPLRFYDWDYQFTTPEDAEFGYDWSLGPIDNRGGDIFRVQSSAKVFRRR